MSIRANPTEHWRRRWTRMAQHVALPSRVGAVRQSVPVAVVAMLLAAKWAQHDGQPAFSREGSMGASAARSGERRARVGGDEL
jgi:hypothetical protein